MCGPSAKLRLDTPKSELLIEKLALCMLRPTKLEIFENIEMPLILFNWCEVVVFGFLSI